MTRLFLMILALTLLPQPAAAQAAFSFEAVIAYNDMRKLVETRFPAGTPREALRKAFVDEGKATQVARPGRDGTEKYIYDINLCGFYIWRWNISADYDDDGKLTQSYVNGLPVFMAGRAKLEPAGHGAKTIYAAAARERPQVKKGRKKINFRMLDIDGDLATLDDQFASGNGPSRADPFFLDANVSYNNVEVWRSIYDADDTGTIAAYQNCKNPPLPQEVKDMLKLP